MLLKDKRLLAIIKSSKQAFGSYKKQIALLIFLGFFSGLLEGLGINALIPLLSFITGSHEGQLDFVSDILEKLFLFFNITFNLKYLLVLICLLFIVKAVVLLFCNYLKIKIAADYEYLVRENLLRQTLRAKWSYLLKQKVGHLETVIVQNAFYGAAVLREISNLIITLTSLLVYIVIALSISASITLITIGLGALVFLALKPLLYKTRILGKEKTYLNKDIAHFINEKVIGMKAIKAEGAERNVQWLGQGFFKRLRGIDIKMHLMKSLNSGLMQPVSLVFVCLIFAFSYLSPNFNFAVFVAIIYLIRRIFGYLEGGQQTLQNLSECVPFLQNLLSYQDSIGLHQEEDKGEASFSFKRELRLEKLSFAYGSEKTILKEINLTLKKGEVLGVIGPSGAGKTTLVDLILRLFKPDQGRITLDQIEASQVSLADWRAKIGYVAQDGFLLNDTIENNIKFFNSQISQADLLEGAKMANIYDFIMEQPEQFKTIVGERGVKISGGQRQRIVLARALAKRPQLLILDEATNALDNNSESLIQQAIDQLKGKITIIIIAHRLSSVIKADNLLVLSGGRIIEQGPPDILLAKKDSYFHQAYNLRN